MGDRMRPIAFGAMMDWALQEVKAQGSVFGVEKLVRYPQGGRKLPLSGEMLEAPFGPAAGPHTQLAQNIVAAYVAGSRFFELKTVQVLDGEDLPVSKPCITAGDECYNCEWSTELRVPEAFDEYVKAWFACKLLSRELGLGDENGFIFNMSVGYDLEGIRTRKIDAYIEGMKDAADSPAWKECRDWTLAHLGRFGKIDAAFAESITPRVSGSITLSTLHGCPPQEIERIAHYLLVEKGLNTYVKCNPTLLGYPFARKTLDALGYSYIAFDDHHFKEDLQIEDAVPMLRRLMQQAREKGLDFGVKLTNTFPVEVAAGELPSEEMYMSGRPLFPLAVSLAQRMAREFDGELRISYSGGADAHNMEGLLAAGIWPVTMATTLLKPGGYQRLYQIADGWIGGEVCPSGGADPGAVGALAEKALGDPYYRKPVKPLPQRKLNRKVPLADCFTAPCREGCPIGQDIPAYLRLAGEGKYQEAMEVITQRNPLPFITGTICSHRCMDKCTRSFYEDSVHIRGIKLEVAQKAYPGWIASLPPPTPRIAGKKAAIVGGGSAGLAAAYFLARAGVDVTLFEKREKLGGIVRYVIPAFRISDEAIDNDIALVKAMGVIVKTGVEVKSTDELWAQGFTDIIYANGAWKPGALKLEYGVAMNVLDFLGCCKNAPDTLDIGGNVAIIGGGNTAMDAARAAKRVKGVEHVRLVYRRSRRYMPADEEELELALSEGVEFCELLAPVGIRDGSLYCNRMALGAPDASGRRSPVATDEIIEIPADTLVSAVGEGIDDAVFTANNIEMTDRGRVKADTATLCTSVPHVYVAGDVNRGPSTVVEAIADAMRVADAIAGGLAEDRFAQLNIGGDYVHALGKKGILSDGACAEAERCLECATVCECCADVCPNRANVAIPVPGRRMRQIVHIDGMCNECGNCATFCPYDSAPYRDKLTLFWDEADFMDSTNEGFVLLDTHCKAFRVRLDGQVSDYSLGDGGTLPQEIGEIITAAFEKAPRLFVRGG